MRWGIVVGVFLWAGTGPVQPAARGADVHSHARPEHVRVRHVELDLEVDFGRQRLSGHATLTVERTSGDPTQPLVLDSRGLQIDRAEASPDGKGFRPARLYGPYRWG